MKKRLRKKLGLGEYTRLTFTLEAKLKELDDEGMDALYNRFIELLEKFECECDGGWCDQELFMTISTGLIGNDNAERRLRFLEALSQFDEITEFDASEL